MCENVCECECECVCVCVCLYEQLMTQSLFEAFSCSVFCVFASVLTALRGPCSSNVFSSL